MQKKRVSTRVGTTGRERGRDVDEHRHITVRSTTSTRCRDPPVQPRLSAATLSRPHRQTRAVGAIGWTPNVVTGEGPRSRTHVLAPRPKT